MIYHPKNLCFLLALTYSTLVPAGETKKQEQRPSEFTHLQKTLSSEDARHLLMRTGVGARPADVLLLRGLSRRQGIVSIIEGIATEPYVPMPEWVNRPLPHYHAQSEMDNEQKSEFHNHRDVEMALLKKWWVLNILQTSSPQTERMVLFWHDIFATNYHGLGKPSLAMARQNETFRALGFGSWERLIKAMIRDAALLRFLNSGTNHKESPNEDLARELLELFVLGEGNFDEAAVREAARSLTGHDTSNFHDLKFLLKTSVQDRSEKRLFGEVGAFDGDDLVGLLLAQEAAPRFLATRFWYAYVSDSKPDDEWIHDQARRFRDSNFSIKSLYRNVLESEAFWSHDNRGSIVKSPVDIVAGTARTLNYPMTQWKKMPQWQKILGMDMFAPPNVAGWKEGAAFITPGHLLNRFRVVRQMVRAAAASADDNKSNSEINSFKMQGLNPETDEKNNVLKGNQSDEAMKSVDERPAHTSRSAISHDPVYRDVENSFMTEGHSIDDSSTIVVNKPLQASAIYIYDGTAKVKNGEYMLDFVLDHLKTPGRDYHHVRFKIEKNKTKPMTLQFDSYSCWPDCVQPWPVCSWIDKNFIARKKITFPLVTTGHKRWTSKFNHKCQFDSLSVGEKGLVSTLWVELPYILAMARKSNRVKNRPDYWLPILDYMGQQFRETPIQFADTAYAAFAQSIDISPKHAPPKPVYQALKGPETNIADVKSLIKKLSKENLTIHDLLLPELSGEHVSDLPRSDVRLSERYLRAVLEHPLFQLK